MVTDRRKRRAMRSKRGLHRFGREIDERIADSRVGRCPWPLEPQPVVESQTVSIDEARDLAVGSGSTQHREYRDKQQWRQRVQPPLRAARITDGFQTLK